MFSGLEAEGGDAGRASVQLLLGRRRLSAGGARHHRGQQRPPRERVVRHVDGQQGSGQRRRQKPMVMRRTCANTQKRRLRISACEKNIIYDNYVAFVRCMTSLRDYTKSLMAACVHGRDIVTMCVCVCVRQTVQVLQVRSQFSGIRSFGHYKFVSAAIILLFCRVISEVCSCARLATRALY